jgi:hypothetical protein
MTNPYCGFGGFLYDWQTLIAALVAGLLALVAAAIAYRATTHQTHYLQREAQRDLARRGIVASRLLDSALQGLDDRAAELERLMEPNSDNYVLAPQHRAALQQIPLEIVWQDLGRFTPDIVRNYISLARDVEKFRAPTTSDPARPEIARIRHIIENLRRLIADEAEHALKRLKE